MQEALSSSSEAVAAGQATTVGRRPSAQLGEIQARLVHRGQEQPAAAGAWCCSLCSQQRTAALLNACRHAPLLSAASLLVRQRRRRNSHYIRIPFPLSIPTPSRLLCAQADALAAKAAAGPRMTFGQLVLGFPTHLGKVLADPVKTLQTLHNVVQVALSVFMAISIVQAALSHGYGIVCNPFDVNEQEITWVTWVFYMSKVSEAVRRGSQAASAPRLHTSRR